jgi:hypothetical protein
MLRTLAIPTVAALVLGGCFSSVEHVNTTSSSSSRTAEARGEMRVLTLGVETLHPRHRDDVALRAIHVRVIVSNYDDVGGWTLDTREQIAELEGQGKSRPAFAIATLGTPPKIALRRDQSSTIDLYYPLPATEQFAPELPKLDVAWRVRANGRELAGRTGFGPLVVARTPPEIALGRTAAYWYDPFWPAAGFDVAAGIPPLFLEHHVPQKPPPRWLARGNGPKM